MCNMCDDSVDRIVSPVIKFLFVFYLLIQFFHLKFFYNRGKSRSLPLDLSLVSLSFLRFFFSFLPDRKAFSVSLSGGTEDKFFSSSIRFCSRVKKVQPCPGSNSYNSSEG